ncbi:hypothetical protein ABKN59_007704 [Abortiporus biennis]
MTDYGAPPVIPAELQQYNSYVEDPKWQRKFSAVWTVAFGIALLYNLPHLLRAIRRRRAFTGLFGIWEDLSGSYYTPVNDGHDKKLSQRNGTNKLWGLLTMLLSTLRWSIPGLELSFGQVIIIAGYLATVLICITMNAQLVTNPNRAGFLALAQFPVVFLFATKNSVVSLLLGPGQGYEKLNYIHRWAGRGMFIGAAIHGALWIRNHLQYGLPILGQQKETSGVATFGVLCVLVLTSFRIVRRFFYQGFFIVHVLGYVSFFITVCYHTIYASPWIFPPLAFYGLDILMRMLRYRIKDATLVPIDNNMTLIQVHDCDGGWEAGQHVRLRVFFSNRILESHPLTILNAPATSTCGSSRTLTLAARVCGDWTRALNNYAVDEQDRLKGEKAESPGAPVMVMIDGPYGGCSIDLGQYESALLVAGGSGVTFTLGVLDDIVTRCVKLNRSKGEKTKRIEFVWCIRSFACIDWFAPQFTEIVNAVAGSSLDLHISIFVTCLCNPEAVPPIPNLTVSIYRPSITTLLSEFVTPPSCSNSKEDSDIEEASIESSLKLQWVGLGGGVGLCASGPESLVREAQNAAARLGIMKGVELGGIGLHTELYAL